MSSTNESPDIHIIRLYNAPLHAVWDAWTDPAQTARWWGPRGFTITTHSKDLRTGGSWHYTMHGPDGTDYPNRTQYLDVQPLTRLVYDHGGYDDRPPMFRVTVLFAEVDGKTQMDMTMHLPDPVTARQTRAFIKQAGGNATWDRLAEYLGKRLHDEEHFVISRSFEAPREQMFDMWTQPEQFARWMGPVGFDTYFERVDIRPDGGTLMRMHSPAFTMYARTHYDEIRRPDLIVYTQQFCDEQGNVTRPGPDWPDTLRCMVEFSAEGPHGTRVTITTAVVGDATADEIAVFTSARAGMTQGWTGTFDKLEAVLEGTVSA